MKTLRQTLVGVVANCLYSPNLLPESFKYEDKVYKIIYKRADSDSWICISAKEDGKEFPDAVLTFA
jgi:hypothetical protein